MAPGPTLKGYLYVIIVEAKDLPNTGEGVEAIDSYCAVFLDGMEEGCTVPAFDTRTPVWNKKIKIKVIGSYDTMDLQLFDADRDEDNHLGIAHVALADVIDEQPHDLWLPFEKREFSSNATPVQGSVHVMIQYSAYRKGQKSRGPPTPKAEASKENEAIVEDEDQETEEERQLAQETAKAEREAMKAQADAAAEKAKSEAEELAREQAHKERLIAEAEAKAAAAKAAKEHAEKLKQEEDDKAAAEAAARAKEMAEEEERMKLEAEKAAAEAKKKAEAAAIVQKKADALRKKRAAQREARRKKKMEAYIAKQKAATEARLKQLESKKEKQKAELERAKRLAAEKRWAKRKERALALAKQKQAQEQARRQRVLEEQARRRAAQKLRRTDMRGFSLFGGLMSMGRGRGRGRGRGGRQRVNKQTQVVQVQKNKKGEVQCPKGCVMKLTKGGRGYERGYRCDGCSEIGRHHRWNCAGCRYDLCKQCGRDSNPSVPVCKQGHTLTKQDKLKGAYRRGYRCDKCAAIKRTGARMHCRRCRYDVCMSCAGKCIPPADDSDSSSDSSESFSESVDPEKGWAMQYEDSVMFM